MVALIYTSRRHGATLLYIWSRLLANLSPIFTLFELRFGLYQLPRKLSPRSTMFTSYLCLSAVWYW